MTITITQKITPENHYLLFMAAEAQRKSEDEVICVDGYIDFCNYKGQVYLPNNLTVKLWIDLNNTCVDHLPENLCSGALYMARTPIKTIPATYQVLDKTDIRAVIGFSVDLSHTLNLTLLPDNFVAPGNLILSHSGISKLPKNCKVNGSLFLMRADIQELPGDLFVKDKIYVDSDAAVNLRLRNPKFYDKINIPF